MFTFINFLNKKNMFYSKRQEWFLFLSELIFVLYSILFSSNINKKDENNNCKEMYIIGTGPSLNNDLKKIEKIDKYDVMSVNNYPLHTSFFKVKPTSHLIIDSMYWQQLANLSLEFQKSVEKFYCNMNQVDWPLDIYVPADKALMIRKRLNNKNINVKSVKFGKFEVNGALSMFILLYLGVLPPRINVTLTAISIAMKKGYENIYILGNDMDKIKSLEVNQDDNKTYYDTSYSYNTSKIKSYNKLNNKEPYMVHIRLMRESLVFKWLTVLSCLARLRKTNIVNISSYSLIDSFVRK